MKFSIVLPVYNVGRYIERCLVSCVHQTYGNIEIIVVDDCGQDDSIQQAERFAEKDSRVKIVRNSQNLGTFHARRVGVENATGEYVLFLDPDDALDLEAVEKIVGCATQIPDIIFCGVKTNPPRKPWQIKTSVPICPETSNYYNNINAILSCKGLQYGTPGKIIKRSLLIRAYGMLGVSSAQRLVYGEDVLLFGALLIAMSTFSAFPQRVYTYFINDGSITSEKCGEKLGYNIRQLDTAASLFSGLRTDEPIHECIKKKLVSRLEVEKLRLGTRKENGFISRLKKQAQIVWITRSFREGARLLVMVITLGDKAF